MPHSPAIIHANPPVVEVGLDLKYIVHIWQNLPLVMDPVAFSIAGLKVHWYGLMYLAAFGTCYYLVQSRIAREPRFAGFSGRKIDDLFFWVIAGVLVGARLGYVVFYHPFYYAAVPGRSFFPLIFPALSASSDFPACHFTAGWPGL